MVAWLCLVGLLSVGPDLVVAAPGSPSGRELPYRFLLVIGDQWTDEASCLIDGPSEFSALVTLLKTWGLPFDILRLDQQRFDPYYIMDREGRPRYGTILWDAGPAGLEGKDLRLLPTLVEQAGVNLVVLGDTLAVPAVSQLAGVECSGSCHSGAGLTWIGRHFITRGVMAKADDFARSKPAGCKTVVKQATVAARRGADAFLTVRELAGGGRVAWLGADRPSMQIGLQVVRDLLKRSLVWAQGYALYAEYPHAVMLIMDDIGTSDRTYLPYWHYRTLNEEDTRRGLIEPLRRHKAVLIQDVITGYVERKTHRVVVPWTQRVTDELDGRTLHDYPSAKRGLEAGLRAGVFEIQCHGYTHMLPDLESPPGPFRTVPMDDKVPSGFDVEFGDSLRKQDVPAITQRFLLQRGLEYLRKDFGVEPLFVMGGGGGWSRAYAHHSARIAAEMGFGLGDLGGMQRYLGRDLVIANMAPIVLRGSWAYNKPLPLHIPWTVDSPSWIVFHDRDISLDITAAQRLLESLGPGVRYMSANEYAGYLHAQVEGEPAAGALVALRLRYDDHYCRYFATHASQWTLHLSDQARSKLGGSCPERRLINIPQGLGPHRVPLRPDAR
jgi:hypothetical protein